MNPAAIILLLIDDRFGGIWRAVSTTDFVKGFGRFSVRKPLMEEPAWALRLSYGDLRFGLVGRTPWTVATTEVTARDTASTVMIEVWNVEPSSFGGRVATR
ncbi:hypothetical protein CVO77_11890 [Sphingopyxis lindanitolerans]|uniref:Uncharacterized protein n=1 Tax=Sphingopyxis lindanitolerans TaxID=2054227 RepID=A0A2S8B9U3_9SPHN|nr:hypothetical protein CVO77_11890 [Sphingopyxis lindanitolerans]